MGDAITQLQEQINFLCSTFYNLPGALQRDAPPKQLDGSQLPIETEYNLESRTADMATEMIVAARSVDTLAGLLPQTAGRESESEQLHRISSLQSEVEKAGQDLQSEITLAEQKLMQLQDLFAVLADSKLGQRQNSASGTTCGDKRQGE